MKTLAFLPFAFLAFSPLRSSAQTEGGTDAPRTIFGSDHELANGGWGAPTASYTRVMDQDAMLVGLRGGWLIDHRVTLGIAGHGLVTDVTNTAYDAHLIEAGRPPHLSSKFRAGYGGLLIEPIIAYQSPVHVSLPLIIGAGGCGYETFTDLPHDFDPYTWHDDVQAFFVIEPGVDLEVNLVRMVRLSLGASYRYTSDIDLPETPADAMRGFNTTFAIKVGCF